VETRSPVTEIDVALSQVIVPREIEVEAVVGEVGSDEVVLGAGVVGDAVVVVVGTALMWVSTPFAQATATLEPTARP
jgi:hypothetical protein